MRDYDFRTSSSVVRRGLGSIGISSAVPKELKMNSPAKAPKRLPRIAIKPTCHHGSHSKIASMIRTGVAMIRQHPAITNEWFILSSKRVGATNRKSFRLVMGGKSAADWETFFL